MRIDITGRQLEYFKAWNRVKHDSFNTDDDRRLIYTFVHQQHDHNFIDATRERNFKKISNICKNINLNIVNKYYIKFFLFTPYSTFNSTVNTMLIISVLYCNQFLVLLKGTFK